MDLLHRFQELVDANLPTFLQDRNITSVELFYGIVAISVINFIFNALSFFGVFSPDESPVAFDLPVPEEVKPGWKGEVLDKPSIKVCTVRSTTEIVI